MVTKDGEIVEFRNVAKQPRASFAISEQDVQRLSEARATWHTHPKGDSNPSVADYLTFLSWPNLLHWIVSPNGANCYQVDSGRLLRCG